jgi:hypothetical protein
MAIEGGGARGARATRGLALGLVGFVLFFLLAGAWAEGQGVGGERAVAEWGLALAVLAGMLGLLWIAWPAPAPIWPFVLTFALAEPLLLHLLLQAQEARSAFGALLVFWAIPLPLVGGLARSLSRQEGETGPAEADEA